MYSLFTIVIIYSCSLLCFYFFLLHKQYCVKALPGLFSVLSNPKKLRLMGHSFTVQMNVNIAYPFYSGPEYRNI